MRIGVLCKKAEYAHSTPVMESMFSLLRRRGVDVETIIPEEHLIDVAAVQPHCDIYILRPGIELALSLAGVLHDKGAHTLNNYPACAIVQDKVRVTHRLIEAGIPTARSFVTGNLKHAMDLLQKPIIVKPHRGSYGEGIRILQQGDATDEFAQGGHFVQEYLPNNGVDIKVYVIGDEVMAIRRPFPAHSFEEKIGTPFKLEPYIEHLALAVGKIFDLKIYGLDIIESNNRLYVIDVNFFPGFVGVCDAAEKLSEYVHTYAFAAECRAEPALASASKLRR